MQQQLLAKNIPVNIVKKVLKALFVAVYPHDEQNGFARVRTDQATFGYLAVMCLS